MTKKIEGLNKKLLAAAEKARGAKAINDLLAKGADVNCVNDWGMTPLMIAAQNNSYVVVLNTLIDAGADVNATEPKYRSNALHLAADKNTNPMLFQH